MKKIVIVALLLLTIVSKANANSLGSLADATCNNTISVVVPASGTTQCVDLTNSGANPARIGDSNCSATRCSQITAGGEKIICTPAPIYCYSTAGTTINITILNGPQ